MAATPQLRCAAVAVAALAIAVLTLTPGDPALASYPHTCLVCGDHGTIDVLQNLVLFAPLGIALRRAGVATLAATFAGLGLSLAVELLQLMVIPGRDATLSDVLSNTLGTLLGAAAAAHWRSLAHPPAPRAGTLALAAASIFIVAIAGTAALLRPSPRPDRWYGQVRPALGRLAVFAGSTRDARLDGHPLTTGRLAGDAQPRARFAGGRIALSAVVSSAVAPVPAAPIVRIVDSTRHEVAALFQRGDALTFTVRPRARDARLRAVQVRLPGVFGPPGEVEATGAREGARVHVAARRGTATRARSVWLTPALGWALVLPFETALDGAWWPDALWLAMLAAPWAWWTARAAGRRWWALLAGLAMAAALPSSAAAARLAQPDPRVWAGLVAGALATMALSRATRRYSPDAKNVGTAARGRRGSRAEATPVVG